MLAALKPAGSSPSTMLTVARRALNATSGQFTPFNADAQVVRELPEDRIQIPGVTQLDGQYIILVTQPKPTGQSESHPPPKIQGHADCLFSTTCNDNECYIASFLYIRESAAFLMATCNLGSWFGCYRAPRPACLLCLK